MKAIDRVYAVQRIVPAMEERMSGADVHVFFRHVGIPEPDWGEYSWSTEGTIREFLKECSDETIIDICQQLGVNVSTAKILDKPYSDGKYWLIDHFRLFISHHHLEKASAGNLRKALMPYGISGFVAHEDIEPTDEWREELRNALMSMDALLAILTAQFKKSSWTDQEVGIAIAQDKLVIPVKKGVDPYGFIDKFHAFDTNKLTVGAVAARIFQIISKHRLTRERILDCMVRLVIASSNADDAIFKVNRLNEISEKEDKTWERIRENISGNNYLISSSPFIKSINDMLDERGLKRLILAKKGSFDRDLDDEIPF
jgi:hypothetical protein